MTVESDAHPKEPLVLLSKHSGIATISLNRPDRHNALNLEMAQALALAAADVAADPHIMALIVNGRGRGFCAGGDLTAIAQHLPNPETYLRALLGAQHQFLMRITAMPKITIAAVHGPVAGAGLSLASMCDLCVSNEDSHFTPAFAKLGISPDSGATFGLARAVGTRQALRLLLAHDSFSATEAFRLGLVTDLATTHSALDVAKQLAETICAAGPDAVGHSKKLLQRLDSEKLEDQLEQELEAIIHCMKTPYFQTTITKFLNRGRPKGAAPSPTI